LSRGGDTVAVRGFFLDRAGAMTQAATYTLMVWLMLKQPASMPFGPFYSASECERAYSLVNSHYRGAVPLLHECRPDASE
jgi:hypothetical protein